MSQSQNLILGGIVVSPVVVQLGVALLLTVLLSWLLLRVGFYRLTWHRPLVEVSIFCILFGALVVLVPDGTPFVAPNASTEPVAR